MNEKKENEMKRILLALLSGVCGFLAFMSIPVFALWSTDFASWESGDRAFAIVFSYFFAVSGALLSWFLTATDHNDVR